MPSHLPISCCANERPSDIIAQRRRPITLIRRRWRVTHTDDRSRSLQVAVVKSVTDVMTSVSMFSPDLMHPAGRSIMHLGGLGFVSPAAQRQRRPVIVIVIVTSCVRKCGVRRGLEQVVTERLRHNTVTRDGTLRSRSMNPMKQAAGASQHGTCIFLYGSLHYIITDIT